MQATELSPALTALAETQHSHGGWGWRPGSPANTECTALSILALDAWHDRHDELRSHMVAGIGWLESTQRADGSWPLSEQVPESSWMTSIASFALARVRPGSSHAIQGGLWLLGQRSRSHAPSLVERLRAAVRNEPPMVDQDEGLQAWPWSADTTAWVEPTAWALLALKQLRADMPRRRLAARVDEAHRLLADRMCRGGGWNYGNKAVLGSDLPPYPDTTALGLMALQDAPSREVTEPAILRLREMLADQHSALVLALSISALQLYDRDVAAERSMLAERVATLATDVDVRTLALVLLALDERRSHFRLPGHA